MHESVICDIWAYTSRWMLNIAVYVVACLLPSLFKWTSVPHYFSHDCQKVLPCLMYLKFKIIINVAVSSFCFIWLLTNGSTAIIIFNSFSAGILYRRQNLTSKDGPHSERVEYITPQTRNAEPMLFYCWPRVVDDGPTLNQHWLNASCLQGCHGILVVLNVNWSSWWHRPNHTLFVMHTWCMMTF